jgi:hypothetical protein
MLSLKKVYMSHMNTQRNALTDQCKTYTQKVCCYSNSGCLDKTCIVDHVTVKLRKKEETNITVQKHISYAHATS